MTDFKAQLKAAYDQDAQRRIDNEMKRDEWKLKARKDFLELLKSENKKTVLELGAGVGTDSKFFQDNSLDVLAIDLSKEMVKQCVKKGLRAKILDLYNISELAKKFDGIFSMNVLLHVPRKNLEDILENIYNSLNPSGVFFFGVYGGYDEEKVFTDKTKMGLPRLFSFLSDDSICQVALKWFEIIKFEAVEIGSNKPNFHFQSLFLRKK